MRDEMTWEEVFESRDWLDTEFELFDEEIFDEYV